MLKFKKKKDKTSNCDFATKPGVTFSAITEKSKEKNTEKHYKECSEEKIEETTRTINRTGKLLVMTAIIIILAQCVCTGNNIISLHNDYKNSKFVEAEAIEVFEYGDDKNIVIYRYKDNKNTYDAATVVQNNDIKSGDKNTIRVTKKDPQKILKYNSEQDAILSLVMWLVGLDFLLD